MEKYIGNKTTRLQGTTTIRRISAFVLLLCFTQFLVAKDLPKTILDKAASTLKKEGGVTVGYTISSGGQSDKGTLEMMGRKFHSNMGDVETWFDGKDMWSYVKANNEVNLTAPKSSQLAKVNPYYFLDIYKKGYKLSTGTNTSKYFEVILTAENPKSSISKAVVRIDKNNYHLKYIKVTNPKGMTVEVSVDSYKTMTQKFPTTAFQFNKAKYPKVEVIDLR